MRRADVGEAAGLGLDHRAEVVSPPGALLLEVLPDLGDVFVGHRLVQQVPPGLRSPDRVRIQREPRGVGRQEGARSNAEVGGAAGPLVEMGSGSFSRS